MEPPGLQRISSTGGASVATAADDEEETEDFGGDAQLAARRAALLVIAQDYNIGDAPMLLDTGALHVLRAIAFLGHSNSLARSSSIGISTSESKESEGAGALESKEGEPGDSIDSMAPSSFLTSHLDDPSAIHHATSAR